ncbi:MAG: NAD(P)-dependent oxidoreductase [Desulfosarcinaceae bacterium]|nr:NAD(P)-dependent oxidoreductase [Desulfosarcinaceae bacterium]
MERYHLGWIGTGVMGRSMCGHLLDAGHTISIFNRSRQKTDDLVARGATWCESPAAVAEQSDIVFSIVGFPEDVRSVILGPEGILAGGKAGQIVVDMTTSSPALAQEIEAACRTRQMAALDAPVSGGDIGARNASLAIMVGGAPDDYERVLPLFQLMGENIQLMGPAGAGQHTKMCNQILIAGTMIGVVESLLYARRVGLDMHAVIDVIGKGAAASWSINNLGRRIADQDFDPGFYVKHFVKDMGIALEEARRLKLSLPGLAMVQQFYIAAMAQGWEDLGTQGLFKVLDALNAPA